jgi:HEPN domain
MSGHRIERLLEARNLEEVWADDAEVVAIWAAALREWSDASVPGLSVAGAFTHVYQAAFRAATAVLRAAGYRARGALGGHHYVTFYAIGGLGDETLERLGDTLQNIRGGRHTALYGDDEELSPEDLESARHHVSQLLVVAHRRLTTARPGIAARAGPPSPSSGR